MAGKFKVKSVINLDEAKVGDEIQESDYSTLTQSNKFVQLEYIEDNKDPEPFKVTPGIYSIMNTQVGFYLEKTAFAKDNILDDFVNTKEIEDKADCFFRNTHKYKDLGFDVAKRNMLLFGPPGTGKSTAITKIANKYNADGKTAVIIYPTVKYEAYQVKDFIRSWAYEGVERLILVMEDIGGVEVDERRHAADAGLLSLLDNQEKTLKIPTLIIATTNFPEALMGSLTNRPGRFDDKIKAGYPRAEARVKLMEFFAKRKLQETEQSILSAKSADSLSPAHLKEALVRSVIHEKTLETTLKEVVKEIEDYNKAFQDKNGRLGFGG